MMDTITAAHRLFVNGNPIVPDIGQSGLRLLFTCIPIAVISVVPSDDPMGANATTASYD